jgi:hypothetical protein
MQFPMATVKKNALYNHWGPVSPTAVKVNCRLKCFVTVVTYCYNNVFVYFYLQLTLTGVGETGAESL